MSDFLYKLGQSKAEKLQEEFTMIHNDTAFQIISEIGSEGFTLYFALSTYAYGKNKVIVFPSNELLSKRLNVSDRTIRRWKSKCELSGAIRTVPCYLPNGTQTANVILFNASYPEKPEEWDTFAKNGFVMVNGSPMLSEDLENLVTLGRTKMSTHINQGGQNRPPISKYPDKTVQGRWTELSAPAHAEIACTIRDEVLFFKGEEEEVKEDNNNYVCVNESIIKLIASYRSTTGDESDEMQLAHIFENLIGKYGTNNILEKIKVIGRIEDYRVAPIATLKSALAGDWGTPKVTTTKSKKRPVNAQPETQTKQDNRYEAFYKLFPDS